ncbi:MAG: DUF1850 domain-containing protein [Synergistaceae bacterium]|jgi:hypothetical protein|nr:DUF1850 domain-containing protein [Synergistaceae bacterium]
MTALLASALCFPHGSEAGDGVFLRIRDWKTGEMLAEAPARVGGRVFFGWIHSLELIPWGEYYHIDENLSLILDAITFPAFGAGIPENKGKVCYVRDGLIYMEGIGQKFDELAWLNSHTATQEITLDEMFVARGAALPHHARLRLVVERGEVNESR